MEPVRSPEALSPIRLLIVADVRLYREGLAAVMPPERLQVVGTADTRDVAAAVAQAQRPDAVLIDVTMPEALALMRQLRADPPFSNIIAFGVSDDVPTIVACAEAGAVAYVGTKAGVEELIAVVHGAVTGELA